MILLARELPPAGDGLLGSEPCLLLRKAVHLLLVLRHLLSLDGVEGAEGVLALVLGHPGLLVRHVGGEVVPGVGGGGPEPSVGSGGTEFSELSSNFTAWWIFLLLRGEVTGSSLSNIKTGGWFCSVSVPSISYLIISSLMLVLVLATVS